MKDTLTATRNPAKRVSSTICPELKKVLVEVEDTLRRIFRERFIGLVLFGSYARGNAVQGSDVDLGKAKAFGKEDTMQRDRRAFSPARHGYFHCSVGYSRVSHR